MSSTRDRIIEYIKQNHQARPHDLVNYFGLSNMAIHKQLRKLVLEGILEKAGKPPLVFYILSSKLPVEIGKLKFPQELEEIINANFLSITPVGNLLYGMEGFIYWAKIYQKNKQIDLLVKEYAKAFKNIDKHKTKEGLIDASSKLSDFPVKYVDKLFYQTIYSLPLFGRTKLAKIVMYAKQIEDKNLIDKIATLGKPYIEKIIKTYNINAVCFIPPTLPRKLQFMDELESRLNLSLPKVDLVKAGSGDILIPQKTLSSLGASFTDKTVTRTVLFTDEEPSFANILLIDDVAGSGASFNETAKKLKALKIGFRKIIAFAFVGNIKGYDVIRQI